jgi:hypothetical protein
MLEAFPQPVNALYVLGEYSGNRGLPGRPARRLNKTPTTGPPMPRLVDHHASRALAYRTRAIELATQAKREDDPGQRRFLLDLARNMVNVADQIDPPPPPGEPLGQ